MISIGPDPAAFAMFGRSLAGPPPEIVPPVASPVIRVAALLGQSEPFLAIFDSSAYSTSFGLYPGVLPGVDVQVAIPQLGNSTGQPVIRAVTQSSATARSVGPGAVSLGNLWHVGSGGQALRVAGLVRSGTSLPQMLDDDEVPVRRSFADDKAVVDLAQATWGLIQRATYNWHFSEAPAAQTLFDSRAPHFYGINPDGTPYDFVSGDLEHCLIDTTGRGFGLFAADTKIDVMYPGNAVENGAIDLLDPPQPNYTTTPSGVRIEGKIRQNGVPAYAQRRDFTTRSPSANRGIATVTPALVVMGDYVGGVQKAYPAQEASHAALQSKYGQILWGQEVAFSLLCSYGHAQPARLNRTQVASNGAYVDFVFDLPAGAVLSTHRIRDGLTVTAPRPHQQQVMGFVISRFGNTDRTARPVYRTDNTDAAAYPVAYRGTVTIHDAGQDVTGGREGVVRVVPQVTFANGDRVQFGADGNYGAFILSGHPDYDAQLALDGLRAYEARLDDGTAFGYPGGPVVNQEEVTVAGLAGVTPPAAAPRVSRTNTDSMWLQGPAIPVDTTALTFLFKGSLNVQAGTGDRNIMALSALGLVLSVETRANQRAAKVRLENSIGGVLYDSFYFTDRVPAAGVDMTLMLTATQNDGSGAWRIGLYLNGALLETIRTGTSGVPARFENGQNYELFRGAVGMTLERAAIWTEYSATGAEPTTGLVADLQGNAAFWNGTGLPAGWTRQGTGAWVDA